MGGWFKWFSTQSRKLLIRRVWRINELLTSLPSGSIFSVTGLWYFVDGKSRGTSRINSKFIFTAGHQKNIRGSWSRIGEWIERIYANPNENHLLQAHRTSTWVATLYCFTCQCWSCTVHVLHCVHTIIQCLLYVQARWRYMKGEFLTYNNRKSASGYLPNQHFCSRAADTGWAH